MIWTIFILTSIGSFLSLTGGIWILFNKNQDKAQILKLTSFAAGVLLSAAFLDLLPEAQEQMNQVSQGNIFLSCLAGIIVFFLLERSLLWFHHHHEAHGIKPTILMILVGDSLHNFIDGVAIATAYLLNPAVGLTTAVAVAAHEIPQEIADFSILLARGVKKTKVVIFNAISAATALLGAFGMYYYSSVLTQYLGSITAFTGGMFIYIALSDLIPELHHSDSRKESFPQAVTFLIGVILMLFIKNFIQ